MILSSPTLKSGSASIKAKVTGCTLNCHSRTRRAKSDSALTLHQVVDKNCPVDTSIKTPRLTNMPPADDEARASSHPVTFRVEPDHRELKREIKRVALLRDKLYSRRLLLKEKRNELRQEREVLVDADSRFMKGVRRFRANSKERFDDSCHDELDRQRDVVGGLQYDYDQAEDEQDVYEIQLEKEEEKLTTLLSTFILPDDVDESQEESLSDRSMTSHRFLNVPESSEAPVVEKSRLAEYESRIGDARIMQERLQDILFEQERRQSFARKREKFGLHHNTSVVSTEDIEFRHAEVAKELDMINEDVRRLHEELQVDGYSFPEERVSEKHEVGSVSERHSPLLAPQGRQVHRSASEGVVPAIVHQVAMLQDRVNRWIFKTFGDSPLEHVRHKLIIGDLCSLDNENWANVVLEHWKDEVGSEDGEMGASMLRSGTLKAKEAMELFEREFSHSRAPKDRATPYKEGFLEYDLLSEWESRSH